ncbi:Protein of unknown function [Terribacillus halophilus]|uniref:DUF2515 domain-containing protein n=1 Tax=Terribacillus halophilus TaxID=361279 RepID=A0A1G6V5N0_9BACI|nr:DUF2515 family protein [Terribacillus halophilus]SDD48733.1 Protein of unknown function [Terribacillus halophilus]
MTFTDIAELLASIEEKTASANLDNIRRTMAYQAFYERNPEIRWAFLASMVSRNAGWNMTDLQLDMFRCLLSARIRKQLFSLYERANWLIFSDAYPQLLLYEAHKQGKIDMTCHLRHFHVSAFMKEAWQLYLDENDGQRLLYSLIVNEQHVIGSPVIIQPFYQEHIFRRWPYLFQDLFRLNAVFFPTLDGKLYGLYAHHFTSIDDRIRMGKELSQLLFHDQLHQAFVQFAQKTPHTASRNDYERFGRFRTAGSGPLRQCYPVISHQDSIRKDWYRNGGIKQNWLKAPADKEFRPTGSVFYWKRKMMALAAVFFKKKSKAVQ